MLVIFAPDSFKGSMTSRQAAMAMQRGIQKVFPKARCLSFPMADGGEGTLEALVAYTKGKYYYKKVTGPDRKPVRAKYGLSRDGSTAIIEMAQASGMTLLNRRSRNPLKTTTFGTGELILTAANKGVKNIIVGIGGSGTNDGGAGMTQALGVKFINKYGRVIKTPLTGGILGDVAEIDCSQISPLISKVSISIACDVTNILCGKQGASHVFAQQKGATPQMVKLLDKNLRAFGELIEKSLGIDVFTLEGGGAAGGLGAGLVAFAGARLERGIEIVIKASGIEKQMKKADLVLTGEGRIDGQTIYGKAVIGIAKLAKQYDVPVVAIGGSLGKDANVVLDYGIDKIESCIKEGMTIEEVMSNAPVLLKDATERAMHSWKAMTCPQ